MKKIGSFIFLVCGLCVTLCSANISNLHWQKQQLLNYHQSGVYQTTIEQIADQAQRYLAHRLQQPHAKPLAVMIDIDETALSNFKAIRALWKIEENVGDTIDAKDLHVITHPFDDPAIKPILQLYRFARHHQVAVFFITGRTANDLKGTVRNLKQAGYHTWKQLIVREPGQYHLSALQFKRSAAKRIRQQGFDLVFAIGDQYSDLPKKQADACFKVPNPFYYIA